MSTGKHQIPDDGTVRRQQEPPQRKQAEAALPLTADRWYRRASFWRAVAGMAIAIALGCSAVALETAFELSSRSASFHRRLEVLDSRIARLRAQAADDGHQLAALRAKQALGAKVNRVLSAADVMVLRLTPGARSSERGLLAVSKQSGSAIIEIAELHIATDQTCVIWWLLARGPPAKAAASKPDADGRLSLAIQMPPRGARIAGAIVTLESGQLVDQPKGRIVLKAMLPAAKVLS
jgi:hypothetical protein